MKRKKTVHQKKWAFSWVLKLCSESDDRIVADSLFHDSGLRLQTKFIAFATFSIVLFYIMTAVSVYVCTFLSCSCFTVSGMICHRPVRPCVYYPAHSEFQTFKTHWRQYCFVSLCLQCVLKVWNSECYPIRTAQYKFTYLLTYLQLSKQTNK